MPSRHGTFLAAVLGVFLFRALAADAIVPPWQGPDEPSHFALAKLLNTSPDGARADVEARILQSMARHGWWEAYQQPTPQPVPRTFPQVPGHLADNVSRGSMSQPVYYLLGAGTLRIAASADIETEYRLLRWLSVALGVLTLICGWAGTRLLFGDAVAAGAISVAALHPQFLLTALSVNPDALVNLCGAFMWWQAARLQKDDGWRRIGVALLVLAAAAVAAWSKRNGVPLLLIAAALLAVVVAASMGIVHRWRAVGVVAVAALGAAVSVYLFEDRLPPSIQEMIGTLRNALIVRRSAAHTGISDVIALLRSAVDTSWLVGGWLRFPAPEWWLWVVRLITLAGFLGALRAWIERGPAVRALSLAWLFVLLHAVPLLAIAFVIASVPQGRYLFAVLVPACALLIVGIQRWFPAGLRRGAITAVVVVVACLDAIGFVTVLIPAYS